MIRNIIFDWSGTLVDDLPAVLQATNHVFRLAGIPPLAGFYAKWWILSALLDAGYLGLCIIALVASVVGAFYYLRVVKVMIFDDGGQAHAGSTPLDLRVILSVNGLLLVLIGILPQQLLELCARAAALL